MVRRISTGWLIRIAVIVTMAGLLLLVPILLRVSGMAVGMYMLGSLLITLGIVIYVVGVVRELRRKEAL